MTELSYLHCPLWPCSWRTVDRSHLTTVVMADGEDENGRPNLVTRDAVQVIREELRMHLAAEHRRELQLLLAHADGAAGEPVRVGLVQDIDAVQVRGAEDLVASTLVPQMRARFARDMAAKNLRPLDPWPAVIVHRYVWRDAPGYAAAMFDGSNPPGMREAHNGERPDFYRFELSTLAVNDAGTVQL